MLLYLHLRAQRFQDSLPIRACHTVDLRQPYALLNSKQEGLERGVQAHPPTKIWNEKKVMMFLQGVRL